MNKRLLIIISILSLALVGCGPQQIKLQEGENKETKTEESQKIKTLNYENKQYRLKADFPSNRTFEENKFGTNVIFFAPEDLEKKSKENLGITIKLIGSGDDLKSIYQENIKNVQNLAQNLEIKNETDLKIDGFPAKQVQYSFSKGDYNIIIEQTIIIKNELVYLINYTATKENFKKHKEDAEKILSSLRIR